MERPSFFQLALAAALVAAVCAPAAAQTTQKSSPPELQLKQLNQLPRPMPFPPGSGARGPAKPIEFLSPEQMTQADREAVNAGQPAIRERAGFAGIEFSQGQWSYQQIVCPAFPNHVLLKFTQNGGEGDESVFTASIPRRGPGQSGGQIRIIPILRRGYSLFSDAPINGLTISAFNHIREEEHFQNTPDWLSTGLCYAALGGAHPQVELGPASTEARSFPSAVPAVLEIPAEGGAVISFLDSAGTPKPTQWSMVFDGKGKLLKATQTSAPSIQPIPLPDSFAVPKGTLIPSTTAEAKGKPTPQ